MNPKQEAVVHDFKTFQYLQVSIEFKNKDKISNQQQKYRSPKHGIKAIKAKHPIHIPTNNSFDKSLKVSEPTVTSGLDCTEFGHPTVTPKA